MTEYLPLLETALTYLFGALAAIAALGFVFFRQPVYAALNFALAVLSGSGLYLIQKAPMAAAATVLVYAGATIIIFLFVLMFAQRSQLQAYDESRSNFVQALIATIVLGGVLWYGVSASLLQTPIVANATNIELTPATGVVPSETLTPVNNLHDVMPTVPTPTVAMLGRTMYTQYLWAIELAGAILLVATLGAIYLARDPADDATAVGGSST